VMFPATSIVATGCWDVGATSQTPEDAYCEAGWSVPIEPQKWAPHLPFPYMSTPSAAHPGVHLYGPYSRIGYRPLRCLRSFLFLPYLPFFPLFISFFIPRPRACSAPQTGTKVPEASRMSFLRYALCNCTLREDAVVGCSLQSLHGTAATWFYTLPVLNETVRILPGNIACRGLFGAAKRKIRWAVPVRRIEMLGHSCIFQPGNMPERHTETPT
jgi:hypothetical protein